MSALSIQPTYPIFTETDGQPLESGYIWIGTVNLDPQVNPINVYFDAALTILAAQPIRTINGYPSRNGTPARLYVDSDYSIRVMNKNGSTVYSAPAATERYSDIVLNVNAENVVYDPPFTSGVQTNVEAKLAQTVSVLDFGADSTGILDSTAAIQAAIDTGSRVFIPKGTYIVTNTLTINTEGQEIIGESMMYTIIKCTNSALATPVIRTNPADSRFWGLVLSDFKVEVPNGSSNDVIQINSPNWRCTLNRLWLRPVSIGGSTGTAIHFRRADPQGTGIFDGYFTTVQECFVEGFGRGVWYDNVDGGMNCNWIERTSVTLCSEYGIYQEGGSTLVVSKNHLEQNDIHVFLENSVGCVVSDNYMERSVNESIKVDGGHNHTIYANYIASAHTNSISGAFGAIEIDNCTYCKVSENNFNEKFVDYFVAVYSLARGTLILNNTCRRRAIAGGITANATVNVYDAGISTINIRPVMDGSGNITYQQNGAIKFNDGITGPLNVTDEVTTPEIGGSATVNFTPDTTWTTIATITNVGSGLVTATVDKAGAHLTATAVFSASFGVGSVAILSSAYTVVNTIEFQTVTSGSDVLLQVRTSANFTVPERSFARVLNLKIAN